MIHVVQQVWKEGRCAWTQLDVGAMIAVVDSVVEQITKVSTPSLSNGQNIAVHMVRLHKVIAIIVQPGRRVATSVILHDSRNPNGPVAKARD